MVPRLFVSAIFLVSFCAWGCTRAALVNRTIEDFDPSMQYNCTIQRCDANSTNSNPCNIIGPDPNNKTLTFANKPCQITIPFIGTAVYTFMECSSCKFEVDKTGLHPDIQSDGSPFPLTYVNNTLANGTHTLVVTAPAGMFMDYAVYTVDDESVLTTQGASSTTSASASASGPVKGAPKQKPPNARADVRVIVGGVLGGLVIIVSAAAIIFFKRRAGRRKKLGRIYLVDPYSAAHPSSKSDVEADSSGTVQHDNSVIRLEAQIRELQAEFRAALGTPPQRAPSDGTRLAAMKREQMQAVRDHAPAVVPGDLVLYTDSGMRLTPARQMEELPPDYAEG
ncbi:hypothetical protein B0H19DRAFT_1253240 [Mycena capillaripes]|nr:hypothetical protein B0H19DRAFT_1253240 [Mycena capillaripes]